ncbi:MAG: HAMP domain-containing histidine kinase [Deltaproteobacteria bacterium]|nr:MAG: HAMP domain-containing histidine kinase [Deltaproteobacteria bacterium]TNF29218.1 MAG: HAMP domain-containing histidine kinase [Deltaproteobacteria bacterium]
MNKKLNLVPFLSVLWAVLIFALGAWWLYLILKFSSEGLGNLPGQKKVLNMIAWEGGTFMVLLILLSTTLISYFMKDMKKTKALQAFFAGLTHELKTPLASMRLQAEVLKDVIEKEKPDPDRVRKLSGRMIEDAMNLETQMDKILQLSRLERGGTLNITTVNLTKLVKKLTEKFGEGLELILENFDKDLKIEADEFAIELIMKNLFENTRIHSKNKQVRMSISEGESILLRYDDVSAGFEGDFNRLTELFYKHNSARGSGIGLYLINQLMILMNGRLRFFLGENKGLLFELQFPKGHKDEN